MNETHDDSGSGGNLDAGTSAPIDHEPTQFLTDNSWGRLIGALVSPVATFRSIRRRPTFLVALLVIAIATAGVQALAFSKIDFREVIEQQLEARGQEITEAQLDQAVQLQSSVGFGCAVLFMPIAIPLVGLLFMVVINLFGGEIDFKRSLSTVVYAMTPLLISIVLGAVVLANRQTLTAEEMQAGSVLASNLAAFAPDGASPMLLAVLSSLDVFSLWVVILLAVGFAQTAAVSQGVAAGVSFGFWALWVVVRVALASLQGLGGGGGG